ncbi:MAG: hypothetical protein DDT22_00690 [candidate division WS2 bacterium]|nr:hypothetical protein [Candidatus Lithacetigena glycinireducens]MBT9175016.1 hypothetical protein [Candidatus Lithacetigena glycinireducens]
MMPVLVGIFVLFMVSDVAANVIFERCQPNRAVTVSFEFQSRVNSVVATNIESRFLPSSATFSRYSMNARSSPDGFVFLTYSSGIVRNLNCIVLEDERTKFYYNILMGLAGIFCASLVMFVILRSM